MAREVMVAAEVGVGLVGEDALQQGFLHLARSLGRRLEAGQLPADRAGDRPCRRTLRRNCRERLMRSPVTGMLEDRARAEGPQSDTRAVSGSWRSCAVALVDCLGSSRAFLPGASRKNSSTRRRYSSPATWSAWLCLAPSTSQNSFGSPAQVEEGLGHLRLDVGVAAAVDHEERPRRQPPDGLLQVGEAAAALASRSAAARPGRRRP